MHFRILYTFTAITNTKDWLETDERSYDGLLSRAYGKHITEPRFKHTYEDQR